MTSAAMIGCDGLTVRYGAATAADRVSFGVEAGQVFGLLGPNGAGKTSVIRALTTIIDPDAGRVRIDGVTLDDPTGIRSRIGVLPESSGYPGQRSALEYLTFHSRLFGAALDPARARAAELLELVGLADVATRRIATFSRGMRQRLGIARALVNGPRALFLDEPTLGLDPAGQLEILSFLRREAADEGMAVVLCSHLLDEVERVCDVVGILHHGRIVASGRVGEVIASARVLGGARLELDPAAAPRFLELIDRQDGMRATVDPLEPGRVGIDFRRGVGLTDLAGLLGREAIPFVSLEARGARLSDAFLQLTGTTEEVITR